MKTWKQFDKKLKRDRWRARFDLNNKTFRPVADTERELRLIIADIFKQEDREQSNKKNNTELEIISYIPTLAEVFEKILPMIPKEHQRTLAERVFETLLFLLPSLIKVNQLTTRHFQLYIDYRGGQLGKQSKQPIRKQTIYKELYSVKSALKKSRLYYDSLEKWQVPELPELPKGFKKKSKRERLVSDKELSAIIAALMKEPEGRQTHAHHFHHVRLAHTLEFAYWSGLRRKEISRLKFSQYDETERALLNVRRWKTDTVTKFVPLGWRAIEIIEVRRTLQKDSDYIFTPDGEPVESNYRTLKKVCKDLKIPYGRYAEDGFVIHDLRHNFGTEILRESDIETARELLGHSDISQTGTYIHTSHDRLREAIRKRDKIDYDAELKRVFAAVKIDELNEQDFIVKLKQILNF